MKSPKIYSTPQITYNGRSTFNNPDINPGWASLFYLRYSAGYSPLNGSSLVASRIGAWGDNAFNGAAACFVANPSAPNTPLYQDRTYKIDRYEALADYAWVPNSLTVGWSRNIGNAAYGSWQAQNTMSVFDLNPPCKNFVTETDEMDNGPCSAFYVKPAFYLTGRGANGTARVMHQAGAAFLWTSARVRVSLAASSSQDEDQTIEDALKTIVSLAGGSATCKALIDEVHTFTAGDALNALGDSENFVATFDLPALADGKYAGIAFRSETPFSNGGGIPTSSGEACYLEIIRGNTAYYLDLVDVQSGGDVIERITIRPTNLNGAVTGNVPVGTVKVSVQDDTASVWLNGRFLHTFHFEGYAGKYVAFITNQACSFHIHLSELDDLLADVVVGTRGNGMSVISELLADRHIYWREQPDGSLYFYKTRIFIGDMPDIISGVSTSTVDEVISRVRAEGLNISEIANVDHLKAYGNRFVTINSRYANNVPEVRAEALKTSSTSVCSSQSRRYQMVVHPGLQPGDAATFIDRLAGTSDMAVRSQSIAVGFNGNNFACDMQCDAMMFEK